MVGGGDLQRCRSLFKRALAALPVDDHLELVCDEWIEVERERGTLQSWKEAKER